VLSSEESNGWLIHLRKSVTSAHKNKPTKAQKQWKTFCSALKAFEASLQQPKNDFIRDSAIKRFELTYEATWKLLQTLVRDQGLEANSPREAFRAAFKLGWIEDEMIWDEIIRERNLAVHTYSQELADIVYEDLPKLKSAFLGLKIKLGAAYTFED
jgi:nucleotidyltransferase substrate binding protein (TIGR01987 family)